MNWIKDNLIMVLATACGALVLALTIMYFWSSARYSRLEASSATVTSNYALAKEANVSCTDARAKLADANAQWRALATARKDQAAGAVARLALLDEKNRTSASENSLLRAKLARGNPDVDAHLRSGIPCALARQLWPEAGYCSK